jgi:hypothetical protein
MLIIVVSHVILQLREGSPSFTEGVLHPVHEFVNCLNMQSTIDRFETHARVSASIGKERCVFGRSMDMVVISEFSHRKPFIPIVLPFVHENVQVLLEFLIYMFGRLSD